MPNSTFTFKQFVIKQDKCAMKVGTDAVLLGSWVVPNGSKAILDIGTGTGIISLMLAQKSQGFIHAIDIDEDAVEQASENVNQSIFKDKVSVSQTSFQDFVKQSTIKYNLIVTNPPYFVDSFKSNNEQRSHARHNHVLPFEELINGVVQVLDTKGKFCLILPKTEAIRFRELAEIKGLFLSKLLRVRTRNIKETEKRHLMQFEFKQTEFSESVLIIENNDRHNYTEEYKALTKDYYVNF